MTELRAGHTTKHPCHFLKDYEAFYQANYGLVLGYLKSRTTSLADAEDVAGKVFLYCYEKWDTYDPAKASQQTWLFMIVRSRWIDFLRNARPHANIDEMDEILTAEEDPLENAMRLDAIRTELAEALKKMQPNQRQAILMRYFGEYTDEEIARHLHTTAGNIRVLIHRGIQKLRAEQAIAELL